MELFFFFLAVVHFADNENMSGACYFVDLFQKYHI
jgi:hypothetical protein